MKKVILFLMTLFSLTSCGMKKIDAELSENYYRTSTGGIVYSRNGNWYELGKKEIENVDKKTFRVLGPDYAKDKNHIYYQNGIMTSVDYDSFELMDKNGTLVRDKNKVYYTGITLKGVSPIDIEIIKYDSSNSDLYLRNRDGVYWLRGNEPDTIKKLEVKNKEKFIVIDSSKELAYEGDTMFYQAAVLSVKYNEKIKPVYSSIGTAFSNGSNFYTISWKENLGSIKDKVNISITPIKTVYGTSFLQEYKGIKIIEENYPWIVLDKEILGVYSEETNSIDFITDINDDYKVQGRYFFTGDKVFTFDKIQIGNKNDSVYLNKQMRTEIITINNKSGDFQVLEIKWDDNGIPDTRYAKNEKNVYFMGEILEGADPKTVETAPMHGYDKVNKRYYRYDIKDKNSYYINGKAIDSKAAEKK